MRKLATVRKITELLPIPDADRIELAVVDGWKCVTKKGEFNVGDHVVYCEIDSFLPVRDEFEFLRKSSFKMMGEQEGFRLRTVKLRGQISQGLLIPTNVLVGTFELGDDVTAQLGIEKYEPPIPTNLTGTVRGGFPGTIRKTEEERVQNLSDVFETFLDLKFHVTEKLDGTSMTVFWDGARFGVCGRNWEYEESAGNAYWNCANRLGLSQKLAELDRPIAFQGELVGPKIQKNRYKLTELEFRVFNAFDIAAGGYVEKTELAELTSSLDLQTVPFVTDRNVPDSIDALLKLAEGPSLLNPDAEREGLVWVNGSGSSRVSFKTISNVFLANEGSR